MLDRRRFVLTTLASPALTACGAGGDVAANRYVQTPLLASHARYGARFTQPGFVNGWGIAIRPAGAEAISGLAAGARPGSSSVTWLARPIPGCAPCTRTACAKWPFRAPMP